MRPVFIKLAVSSEIVGRSGTGDFEMTSGVFFAGKNIRFDTLLTGCLAARRFTVIRNARQSKALILQRAMTASPSMISSRITPNTTKQTAKITATGRTTNEVGTADLKVPPIIPVWRSFETGNEEFSDRNDAFGRYAHASHGRRSA